MIDNKNCGNCENYKPSDKEFLGVCKLDDDNCHVNLKCSEWEAKKPSQQIINAFKTSEVSDAKI